ncbi:hypothetical protein ABVT39_002393 [Epinephelus coioides]
MKTFSVAVAVAIVLAFICTQESSALPVTGVEELVELVSSDDPVADHQELPVELGEVEELVELVSSDDPVADHQELPVELGEMKTFSVAVAVAIVLAFICTQESSALPVTGVEELVELVSSDDPVADHQELPVELGEMPFNIEGEQQSGAIKCRFCCSCCAFGFCGMCCK